MHEEVNGEGGKRGAPAPHGLRAETVVTNEQEFILIMNVEQSSFSKVVLNVDRLIVITERLVEERC